MTNSKQNKMNDYVEANVGDALYDYNKPYDVILALTARHPNCGRYGTQKYFATRAMVINSLLSMNVIGFDSVVTSNAAKISRDSNITESRT